MPECQGETRAARRCLLRLAFYTGLGGGGRCILNTAMDFRIAAGLYRAAQGKLNQTAPRHYKALLHAPYDFNTERP